MADQAPGFVINQRTVTFTAGVISLLVMIFGFVTMFNNYTFRIDQLEKRNAELISKINKLEANINDLEDTLTEFKIVLNRINDRTVGK